MKTVLLVFLFLSSYNCFSQRHISNTTQDSKAETGGIYKYEGWSKGYLVMEKGDTIHGLLNTPAAARHYTYDPAVIQVHSDGKKDKSYTADVVSYYEYKDTAGAWIRYVSYLLPISDGSKIFLCRYIDDKCKIYFLHTLNKAAQGMTGPLDLPFSYTDTAFFVQKGTSSMWRLQFSLFKKDMSEFFQKCPDMVTRIKDGTFTYDNWRSMVVYYNNNGCH